MNSETSQEIFEYSRRGMLDHLRCVVTKEHPDSYVAYDGSTALLMASKNGHLSVCELLIQHGANPKMRTEDGSTALILACTTGSLNLVEFLLLVCPSDLNECNEDGFTPLDMAKYYNYTEIVSLLESKGGVASGIETPENTEVVAGPSEKWGYGVFDM
jgi:ankyrin repeat protein